MPSPSDPSPVPPTSEAHTPGPWHSFQNAIGTHYLVVAGDGSKPNEPVVATITGYTATTHAAEAANARLVAASPTLLEACEEMSRAQRALIVLAEKAGEYCTGPNYTRLNEALAKANAAIAAAKEGVA